MTNSPTIGIALFKRRSYVPVVSVLLTLLVGNWLADTYAFDPMTAAQNQRIRFQKGGDLSLAVSGLTAPEADLAEAVLEDKRANDSNRAELLYVGNSQVLAIMDQRPGDIITPQWLQVLLARQNDRSGTPPIDVHLAAYPNITLTELLIKLVTAGEQLPRQADILLAAAVLEEFRGLGVRDENGAGLEPPNQRRVDLFFESETWIYLRPERLSSRFSNLHWALRLRVRARLHRSECN